MAIYIADSHALLAGKSPRWQMSDITPVAVMMKVPSFIFVKEDSRFKTWADFANVAKANPGKLKIATLGFGSVDDFSITTIEKSGLKVVQVPFSKPSERYVSILGDHADALYEQAGDVAQFLNGKQMRPILLFGAKRLERFKDIPASYELGYKVALPQFRAIVVKAGTPPDVVAKVNAATNKALNAEPMKGTLAKLGAAPRGGTPKELADGWEAAAAAANNLNHVRNNISSNGDLTTIMLLSTRTDPVQKVELDARRAPEEKISRVEISSPLPKPGDENE
jgi:tripartite-type tricarboxylate transporter receptor subunit TctC